MKKWIILILFFCNISVVKFAQATVSLTLTQGVSSAMPVAIVPFSGDNGELISDIVARDLTNSGRFKVLDKAKLPAKFDFDVWRALKQNHVLTGTVTVKNADHYLVHFTLFDVYKGLPASLDQTMIVSRNQLRQAGHHISDQIYQTLTGVRGIFSTRIAYVLVNRDASNPRFAKYALEVADYDGNNPQPILVSSQPVMSPAWSHDGKKIAYVSFEHKQPQIYISDVTTGARTLISNYIGINGAPAWSADDTQMALVLSKTGNPEIYLMDLSSRQLIQLTSDHQIDTEPFFAPDNRSLLFTSDRGGSPQIYRLSLNTKQVQRMSFNGHYNARASFSPDGSQIVMIHQGDDTQGYGIGLQDIQSGSYSVIDNSGDDQSPSFSPNGQMIIFAVKTGLQRQLALVSVDGRVKLRLPAEQGDIQEPVWGPFLRN